jgi:hypothetical protein
MEIVLGPHLIAQQQVGFAAQAVGRLRIAPSFKALVKSSTAFSRSRHSPRRPTAASALFPGQGLLRLSQSRPAASQMDLRILGFQRQSLIEIDRRFGETVAISFVSPLSHSPRLGPDSTLSPGRNRPGRPAGANLPRQSSASEESLWIGRCQGDGPVVVGARFRQLAVSLMNGGP